MTLLQKHKTTLKHLFLTFLTFAILVASGYNTRAAEPYIKNSHTVSLQQVEDLSRLDVCADLSRCRFIADEFDVRILEHDSVISVMFPDRRYDAYNPLGQMSRMMFGAESDRYNDYGYDMRGRLKTILTPGFSQALYFEDGEAPCYNGCISSMKYGYEPGDNSLMAENTDNVTYTYDALNRLVGSVSSDGYDTSYTYDLNSAITGIVRKGLTSDGVTVGVVDDMTMTYDGNRLTEVSDDADRVTLESSLDFDAQSSTFTYDASGRLTGCSDPLELTLSYAPNDMPVQMKSGLVTANYCYLADGTKLSRTLTKTIPLKPKKRSITYHIGSFRLTKSVLGNWLAIDRISLPWGYFDNNLHANVYIKDYQGNIRAVYNQDESKIIQQTDYYPYGLPKAKSIAPEINPFKYSGKELYTDLPLTHYDFAARLQLPALGLFQRPDPKASDFPWLNSYTFCGGDPVNKVDKNGKWSIKVSASKDRALNPYAILTATDRHAIPIFRTVVKVRGQFRERSRKYGDTPQGKYDIQNWNYRDDNHPVNSFGPNPFLRLWYTEGEGGSRQYMHLHGVNCTPKVGQLYIDFAM